MSRVRKVDTISTEKFRGYVLDTVQVILDDGRAPFVRIWYFAERDGFPAEVDYEIWNEADTRIVQDARTIPGTGFDYSLIAFDCDSERIVQGALIEADCPAYGYDPTPDNYADALLPW